MPTAGVDAIGSPLKDIAHRPEQVAALLGVEPTVEMSPDMLAKLLTHGNGGLKGVPGQARVVVFINKVLSGEQLEIARVVARSILCEDRVDRVVLGAAHSEDPVIEIERRLVAIVLAAGRSTRMGANKLLLPWGNTTVLGQTLSNLAKSNVNDIVVVTGHHAHETEEFVEDLGISAHMNESFATGGMISSVKTGLRVVPENCGAILVVLADQPMVDSETINQILEVWQQGHGELIAPGFDGRRGNPVLFGRQYFMDLLSLPEGSAPRELLQRYKDHVRLVEVNTDTVLHDLDRLEDYERWRPQDN